MRYRARKTAFATAFIMAIVFVGILVSAASFSNPQFISPSITSNYLKSQGVDLYPLYNEKMCGAGQDFIVQVSPLGCSPRVVRSDLLEEQNVPVFCQLEATKINPLIDVNAISQISFKGQYPKEVTGVGFYPANAAVKGTKNTLLNSPVLANIGYAVIVLKQQPNESSMPDSVSGNLTATIKYDIQNAFGIGQASYYLPELSNEDWQSRYKQYGFWNGKGFLRVESIDADSSVVSIYLNNNTKFSTLNLKKGEASEKVFLPGFFCLAGLQLKLDGLDTPDTRAKLSVNGDVAEVAKGEKFLDNACTVRDIVKDGLNQRVSVNCRTDDGGETFDLKINPKIKLEIDGKASVYNVGDQLYDSDGKTVYLGYSGTRLNSGKLEDMYVYLESMPQSKNTLDNSELSEASTIANLLQYNKYTGVGVVNFASALGRISSGLGTSVFKFLKDGKEFSKIGYNEESTIRNKKVRLIGFTEPENNQKILDDNPDLKTNYENAIKDYKTIIEQYPSDKEDANSQQTFGERALINAILVSRDTGQKKTMIDLCKQLVERYPNSQTIIPECTDSLKISSSEISGKSVLLNGNVKQISFEGIYEPSLDEFGAEILVKNPKGETTTYLLGKNQIINMSEDGKETIQLLSMDAKSATVNVNVNPESFLQTVSQATIQSTRKKLDLNIANSFGTKYQFTLTRINLKSQAKISVIPSINNAKTDANVTFNIGIEKRGIQLSPSEIKDKINILNDSIDKWQGISDDLGKSVEGFNALCLTTGTALTVKNFIANTDGKSIARQDVMRKSGGWTDICKTKVANKDYSSLDQCFDRNSDAIDKDVDAVYSIIKNQKSVNESNLCDRLSDIRQGISGNEVSNGLASISSKTLKISDDLDAAFNPDKGTEKCEKISLTQARDLERLNNILQPNSGVSPDIRKSAELERFSILSNINANVESYASYNKYLDSVKKQDWITGASNVDSQSSDRNAVVGSYGGATANSAKGDISKGSNIQPISFDNVGYYVTLKDNGGNKYSIDGVYDEGGIRINDSDDAVKKIKSRYKGFQKYDSLAYQNKFLNPEVQYFETDPYKGWPALVPFDLANGWYAATKQPVAAFGSGSGIKAYDDSGRVTSFWLCNVGENGKAEFNPSNYQTGDDICQQFNPGTGQSYGTFQGLDQSKTNQLVGKAINAINDAQRQYKQGISGNVRIQGTNVKVGKPAVGVPEFQCQDFMSPQDCKLLFNACDPVVCPSSRCNLGGNYYVADVAQSGIVGSTALCLPNFVGFGGDVVVPVCLTGIKAGVDGLVSVQKNYRDCLQANLDTGKTIGICDEIHSIYLCDFFWSQAAPFADAALPTIFEFFSGQSGAKGGGEYLGVQSAWQNAKNSVDYITQYYGANSFSAFKSLATEGVGKAVCHNFISATYPSDVGLSSLIKPRSPPQFSAWFSETPFTTATVPATSQYKVFYHIYAGENNVQNIGAYYTVYLKSPAGTSFYQTNPTVTVATGYIAKGDYASETKDFTAPTGYKELCIRVNNQEECGFKQVSTDFSLNYLNDLYAKEQASNTDVKTESECVSGTNSIYSLANPNLQAGATGALNPQLYNQGIVRICSTDNPGKGTDPAAGTAQGRWLEVGTCDNGQGKVKCYLDRQSVNNVIKAIDIKNETLQAASQKVNDLLKQGNYIQDFDAEIDRINKKSVWDRVSYITQGLIDKALLTSQKAKLIMIRADSYAELARIYYGGTFDPRNDPGGLGPLPKVEERKAVDYGLTSSRAEVTLISTVQRASQESLVNANCEDYIKLIQTYSLQQGIDPLLLLSIIQQESSCNPNAASSAGDSFGLMQITEPTFNDVCTLQIEGPTSTNKIPETFEDIKGQANLENNIWCGAVILKSKYNRYKGGTLFNCEDKSVRYYDWEAAVRGYNGYGCLSSTKNYVEEVMARYKKLNDLYTGKNEEEDPFIN